MSSKVQVLARWKTIKANQCAYRSSNVQTGIMRCRHLFTNTAECHFVGCPIVQPNYVALQRSDDTIYLVEKNSDATEFTQIWTDKDLPPEKEEALKIVTEASNNLSSVLRDATLTKFEHLFEVTTTIRETLVDQDEDDIEIEEIIEESANEESANEESANEESTNEESANEENSE